VTGGDLVVRCLAAQRVRHVFGIPGALNAGLYDALARQEAIEHVLVRHELGAAWMADGYARASGEVGVCVTVPGPGATHAASGIAGAYTDCVPVLLLASRSETRWEGQPTRDLFHGLDQAALFAPITKWHGTVRRAEEIGPTLERAFRELRNGRPGPVMVEVPADVLAGHADGEVPPYVERERPAADTSEVARAVALLRSAARPLLLADDGVLHSGAWDELGALAERLGAPVVTTIQGKSSIPEAHPWSLGDMNSPAGQAAYPLADAVFAVGCRFAQTDIRWPWFTPPPRLVHLDADPAEVGRLYPPEVGLVGDPRTVLRQMLKSGGWGLGVGSRGEPAPTPNPQPPTPRHGWSSQMEDLRRRHRDRTRLPLLAALHRALPTDAVVAFDVCVPGYLSRWEWPITDPRSYYYPGVYVGMGYGLPAAIGARVATGRPTMAVCGDGGFQMTMAELGTAAQIGLAVVVVIINDAGLTLIRRVQDRDYAGRRYAVDLRNPDFAALARAYNIASERVETAEAAGEAVARALARGGPSVIELLQEVA
jgi:thiamine pyrophosphate-dependent acetolactate synthase large subunit-like protein